MTNAPPQCDLEGTEEVDRFGKIRIVRVQVSAKEAQVAGYSRADGYYWRSTFFAKSPDVFMAGFGADWPDEHLAVCEAMLESDKLYAWRWRTLRQRRQS